jgi:hypothetical protein
VLFDGSGIPELAWEKSYVVRMDTLWYDDVALASICIRCRPPAAPTALTCALRPRTSWI